MGDVNKLLGKDGDFATRVRALFNAANVSQQEVADAVGVTRQTFFKYLEGKAQPTIENIYNLADYFHVSSDYLLGLSNSPNPDINNRAIHDRLGLSDETINYLQNEVKLLCGITNKDNIDDAVAVFHQFETLIENKEECDDKSFIDYAKSMGFNLSYCDDNDNHIDLLNLINGFYVQSEVINAIIEDDYFLEALADGTWYRDDCQSILEALYNIISYKPSKHKLYRVAELVDEFDEATDTYVNYRYKNGKKYLWRDKDMFSLLLLKLEQAFTVRQKYIDERNKNTSGDDK